MKNEIATSPVAEVGEPDAESSCFSKPGIPDQRPYPIHDFYLPGGGVWKLLEISG